VEPDALQTAFHDVECISYDQRFGIALDARATRAAVRELSRLTGQRRFGRVLDVGCGTGYLAISLAAQRRARTVHATDISAGMLARTVDNARAAGVRLRPVRATAAALPYEDGAFDSVVSRGVLHHLHDPVAALTEWRRVVRPGGTVVVLSEPSPAADSVGARVARVTQASLGVARRVASATGRPLSAHDPQAEEHQRYWDLVAMAANLHTFTPDELAMLGRRSGYERVEVHAAGLASIVWATVYYVLVGELPELAASERARRRAARTWTALRRLDEVALARVVPGRARLTVQGVFVA
jgi:ubiquinone/menaquinone biosynthesis C-methylase UbiE